MMPVEKLRLRPWLEHALNSGRIPGVKWIDSREKIFQVSWKHASRHGWHVDTDACIFKEWAVHTGRYRERLDKPDPRRWKANFRCALNALPDIKELQARGVTRGNNAFKVYQMLRKNTDFKEKERIKNEKDVASKSKAINKCSKAVMRATPQVFKRQSVIHKSSSVLHGDSSLPVRTSHPISHQALFPAYWAPSAVYSQYHHPHMKDHDYLTTWYDPRPETKEIGVMTYQDIKKEPGSPDSQSKYCSEQYDQEDSEQTLNESHYGNNVKQEKSVPSDEEIVDLVDSMSRDSDSLSHRSDSSSSFDDFEADMNDQEQYSQGSSRKNPQRPSLDLPTKQDLASEYAMSYDYQKTPPPPLTPESTSEILKGITSPVIQSA